MERIDLVAVPKQGTKPFHLIISMIAERAEALKYSSSGAFLGLTWAAGLRAWMVLLALEFGDLPRMTWFNTFVIILLSAAMMGGMLGRARFARLSAGSKHWRWAALAPLTMVAYPLLFMDGFLTTVLGTVFSLHLSAIFNGRIPTAAQTFSALFFTLLMLLLAFGASIPFRHHGPPDE